MKVVLILVDGMRPDAITDIHQAKKIMEKSAFTLDASAVMPSVTLPCHISLFHSVDPTRHGITTNTYVPQVRPVKGLCEVIAEHGKNSAFFYNWEELRDCSRPGSLAYSYFCKGKCYGYDVSNNMVTDEAIKYINKYDADFTFVYLGYTDYAGHMHGWMGEEYMESLDNSWKNIERIISSLSDDYTVIVTADHGGHDRVHGKDVPEDMLIPIIACGKDFNPDYRFKNAGIKDIAPTIAKLLGIEADAEWEGKSLI